jgi:hypothetical protein
MGFDLFPEEKRDNDPWKWKQIMINRCLNFSITVLNIKWLKHSMRKDVTDRQII